LRTVLMLVASRASKSGATLVRFRAAASARELAVASRADKASGSRASIVTTATLINREREMTLQSFAVLAVVVSPPPEAPHFSRPRWRRILDDRGSQ
jgi:hypothetical protein